MRGSPDSLGISSKRSPANHGASLDQSRGWGPLGGRMDWSCDGVNLVLPCEVPGSRSIKGAPNSKSRPLIFGAETYQLSA